MLDPARVRDIFDRAAELPSPERELFLDQACRSGGAHAVSLDSIDLTAPVSADESRNMLDRLDVALERLTAAYPRTASVVQLRYLAGLTLDETALELGLSTGTVKREWTFAKAWLAAALDASDS